jgi:hypothetical protein
VLSPARTLMMLMAALSNDGARMTTVAVTRGAARSRYLCRAGVITFDTRMLSNFENIRRKRERNANSRVRYSDAPRSSSRTHVRKMHGLFFFSSRPVPSRLVSSRSSLSLALAPSLPPSLPPLSRLSSLPPSLSLRRR